MVLTEILKIWYLDFIKVVCSNIILLPVYVIFVSQTIRFARACSTNEHFIYRGKLLTDTGTMLSPGYQVSRLMSFLQQFTVDKITLFTIYFTKWNVELPLLALIVGTSILILTSSLSSYHFICRWTWGRFYQSTDDAYSSIAPDPISGFSEICVSSLFIKLVYCRLISCTINTSTTYRYIELVYHSEDRITLFKWQRDIKAVTFT